MKRLFVILASCCLMVSCQWWHETFDSPEECVSWYLEQLRSAVDSKDYDSMEELTDDLFDYCDDLEDNRDWESVSVLIREFEEKNGNIEDLLYTRGEKGLVSGSKLDNDRVNHERDDSPKQCVVWYMEQIYKANEKGDSQLVEDLADCLFSYQMRLSRYDLDAVMEVIYQYENRYGRIDAIYYAYDVCEETECCKESCEDSWGECCEASCEESCKNVRTVAEDDCCGDDFYSEFEESYDDAMAEAEKAYDEAMAEVEEAYDEAMAEFEKSYGSADEIVKASMKASEAAMNASMNAAAEAMNASINAATEAMNAAMSLTW